MNKITRPVWRHWYHLTLGTYGRWLPGDLRGWKERNHRKHISKPSNPTQEKFHQSLHKYSKGHMKRPPFFFDPQSFHLIGNHFLHSLKIQNIPALAISIGTEHCHVLAQCLDDKPRTCTATLKCHVYLQMFRGHPTPWDKRSHEQPISDQAHARWAFDYILDHKAENAWTWSFQNKY
jgi:hypothetical protein